MAVIFKMAAPMIELAIQNDDEDLFNLLMIEKFFSQRSSTTFDPTLPPFDFNQFSDIQCWDQFRFQKKDIPVLAQLLGLPPTFTTTNGCVLERVDLMCILLRRLSYPNRCDKWSGQFNIWSTSWQTAFIHDVSWAVANLRKQNSC